MIKVDWDSILRHRGYFTITEGILAPKFLDSIARIEKLGGYIAGGFARAMARLEYDPNHPANQYEDIDIFVTQARDYDQIYNYLSAEYDIYSTTDYNGWLVDNFLYVDKKIQLIRNSYLSPEERMKIFDISVCKAYIQNDKVHVMDECIKDCASLTMHYLKKEKLISTTDVMRVLNRLTKYFEKGFNIELENIMQIYSQIQDKKSRNHFVYCLKDYNKNIIDFDKFETIDKLCSL